MAGRHKVAPVSRWLHKSITVRLTEWWCKVNRISDTHVSWNEPPEESQANELSKKGRFRVKHHPPGVYRLRTHSLSPPTKLLLLRGDFCVSGFTFKIRERNFVKDLTRQSVNVFSFVSDMDSAFLGRSRGARWVSTTSYMERERAGGRGMAADILTCSSRNARNGAKYTWEVPPVECQNVSCGATSRLFWKSNKK